MDNEARKLREYEQRLRDEGVRITRPRRAILQILSQAADHPDAMELFRRALAIDPTISLSTVYRTMKLLTESGVLRRAR